MRGLKNGLIISISLCISIALIVTTLDATSVYATAKTNKENNFQLKNVAPLNSEDNSEKTKPAPIGSDLTLSSDPSKEISKADKRSSEEIIQESKNRVRKEEVVNLRTSNTKTYINEDNTKTMVYSFEPKHYKTKTGELKDMFTTVGLDRGYKETQSVVGKSESTDPVALYAVSGNMTTRFKPFAEGITYNYEGKEFSVKPKNANNVIPKRVSQDGIDKVVYENVFEGIDVEYEVSAGSVKENIIVKNKKAATNFSFEYSGISLTKHPNVEGAIAFVGIDPNQLYISPIVISLQQRGVISEQPATQTINGTSLNIVLNQQWLAKVNQKDFPVIVDPAVYNNVGGTSGNFTAYKSDGYVCPSGTCTPRAGAINDGGWKNWRTVFRIPFNELIGKRLIGAAVHLVQRTDLGGTTSAQTFGISGAQNFNYYCHNAPTVSPLTTIGTEGWYNVTPTISWFANNNDWSGRMCLWGNEISSTTYKAFNANYLEMYIDYDTPPPMATAVTPTDKAVVVTTQPSLKVNPVTDADGDQVEYRFKVSTNTDGETGSVIDSNWMLSNQFTYS